MKQTHILTPAVLMSLLWLSSASPVTAQSPQTSAARPEPIKPIPLEVKLDAGKVALGRKLFHEPKLSKDNTVSCATCHDLGKGGTDRLARSVGIGGAEGLVSSPTVFNSGFNFNQFWDGRAHTLTEQIDGPVQANAEMGATWEGIVSKLNLDSDYVASFKKIYSDGIQPVNIKDAIVQFEMSLSTPNSKFDKFLRGDQTVLSAEEKEGYRKFKSYGCTSCHQGVGVGGNMFETFGAMADYFSARGNVTKADFGRFNITGKEEDRFVFKVPSLRNIALTPPYFHDGSAKRLEDAVEVMGKYQLGRKLSLEDIAQIVKFLNTLTGEYDGKPL